MRPWASEGMDLRGRGSFIGMGGSGRRLRLTSRFQLRSSAFPVSRRFQKKNARRKAMRVARNPKPAARYRMLRNLWPPPTQVLVVSTKRFSPQKPYELYRFRT